MSIMDYLLGRQSERLEGAAAVEPDAVPPSHGDNGEELERIFGFFKTAHPDKWEAMHLGPARDAIEQMIVILKS